MKTVQKNKTLGISAEMISCVCNKRQCHACEKERRFNCYRLRMGWMPLGPIRADPEGRAYLQIQLDEKRAHSGNDDCECLASLR